MAALAPTLLGADYPFLDVMWTMFIFFAWVIFIYLLILVLADNFRRQDHSGWAKAGWTVFVIFLPLFGRADLHDRQATGGPARGVELSTSRSANRKRARRRTPAAPGRSRRAA